MTSYGKCRTVPYMEITTHSKGKTIGVNRDGKPVGHATRVNRAKQPEQWTAFVNIEQPPFDVVRTDFPNADAAVAYLAKHGFARA